MKISRLYRFLIIALLSVIFTAAAYADNQLPVNAFRKSISLNDKLLDRVNKLHEKLSTSKSLPERFVDLRNPLTLKVGIPFLGRVRLVFDKLRYFRIGERSIISEEGKSLDNSKTPLLLRGYVKKQDQKLGVIAGTVQNGELIISLLRDQRGRYVDLRASLRKGDAKTARYRRESFKSSRRADCPHEDEEHQFSVVSEEESVEGEVAASNVSANALSYKVVELAVEADYEYYQANSSNESTTSAAIVSHFNTVEALYEEELRITFDLVSQKIYTSADQPYTKADTDGLLTELAGQTYGINSDLKHLLTGKNLYALINGSPSYGVAGVAYIGVVCASEMNNIGITERFNSPSINTIITAHELGHNFSAGHSSEKSIMYPSVLTAPDYQYFASDSLNSINNHINSYGTCLGRETPEETPEDDEPSDDDSITVELTVSLDKASGIVSLSTSYSDDASACSLGLNISTKKDMSNPHSLGTFTPNGSSSSISGKKKKKAKTRKAYVQATLTCGSKQSVSDVERIRGIKKIDSSKTISNPRWIELKKVTSY